MDQTDEHLIDLLRENARESNVNLARALETSEATVRTRIRRLTEEGVIRQFTVRTRDANIRTLIEVQAETNTHLRQLTDEISEWDEIDAVYEISGDHDLLIVAQAHNTTGLNQVIDRIRQLPQIRSTRTRLILREA